MSYGILGLSVLDLSLHDVITNIPHDPAAVVVYLLLGIFVGLTWHGSRKATVDRHRSVVRSAVSEEAPAHQPDPMVR